MSSSGTLMEKSPKVAMSYAPRFSSKVEPMLVCISMEKQGKFLTGRLALAPLLSGTAVPGAIQWDELFLLRVYTLPQKGDYFRKPSFLFEEDMEESI